MGRTLPPLFRTVRRVWQNSAKGWTFGRFLRKVQNWRVSQNSVKGSIFVWQISAEQSCGAGSGSHLDISPLSVCGFLLMCCFWPVNAGAVALILLTRARCVKQAGAAYTVPIITYGTYQVKNGQGLNLEKVACIKGFRRFRASFRALFQCTNIAPIMYKYCPL